MFINTLMNLGSRDLRKGLKVSIHAASASPRTRTMITTNSQVVLHRTVRMPTRPLPEVDSKVAGQHATENQ